MPMHWPEEVQPYYPWSLAWRDDNDSVTTADLLEVSAARSRRRGWLDPHSVELPLAAAGRAGATRGIESLDAPCLGVDIRASCPGVPGSRLIGHTAPPTRGRRCMPGTTGVQIGVDEPELTLGLGRRSDGHT